MNDRGLFFRMSKALIHSSEWATLPPIAKAVYPAVVVHANSNGKAFPSIDTIARLTGVTSKTAGNGLKAIFDDGLTKHRRIKRFTSRGTYSYDYYLPALPPRHKGSLPIYKITIYHSEWASTSTAAKSVYLSLQAASFLNYQEYADEQGLCATDDSLYTERLYDHIEPELEWLTATANLCGKTVRKSLKELHATGFIDTTTKPWRLFLPITSL